MHCPDCRTEFEAPHDIVQPVRIMRQVLARIKLRCPFTNCNDEICYENFQSHRETCPHRPDRTKRCPYCESDYKVSADHETNCSDIIKNIIKRYYKEKLTLQARLDEASSKLSQALQQLEDTQMVEFELHGRVNNLEKTKDFVF